MMSRSSRVRLRPHALRKLHRLVGAVFELDGHEHHFTVAEIFQVVHLELVEAVGLMTRLARLIGVFHGAAVMDMLTTAAARHRGPEIIQHMAVEPDALAGGEADDPYARAFVFR